MICVCSCVIVRCPELLLEATSYHRSMCGWFCTVLNSLALRNISTERPVAAIPSQLATLDTAVISLETCVNREIKKWSGKCHVNPNRIIQTISRLQNDLYCVGWGVKLYSLTTNNFTKSSFVTPSSMLHSICGKLEIAYPNCTLWSAFLQTCCFTCCHTSTLLKNSFCLQFQW